jgi:hypothetical protein
MLLRDFFGNGRAWILRIRSNKHWLDCLSNDSDRIVERMVCMLPVREVGSSSWLGTADAFGANLWDIEPMCQVAGICNDEAVIIDSCHAVPI